MAGAGLLRSGRIMGLVATGLDQTSAGRRRACGAVMGLISTVPSHSTPKSMTSKKTKTSKAEFYDKEYNARAGIPNYAEIVTRWQTDSEIARQRAVSIGRDLRYGPHPEETLDLFRAARSDSPLLVFIHGGYWRAIHKNDFSWVAPNLVAAGVSVAVVNYALVPSVKMDSAGGHLTGMMTAADWTDYRNDLPVDVVKAGVAISGLFDLRPIKEAPFLNVDLKLTTKRAVKMSPALMSPRHRMPLVCAVGEIESSEFHRQARLMTSARPNQDARYYAIPGAHHMAAVDALVEPGHPLFETTLRLCHRGGNASVG